jgi:hypothetical protein
VTQPSSTKKSSILYYFSIVQFPSYIFCFIPVVQIWIRNQSSSTLVLIENEFLLRYKYFKIIIQECVSNKKRVVEGKGGQGTLAHPPMMYTGKQKTSLDRQLETRGQSSDRGRAWRSSRITDTSVSLWSNIRTTNFIPQNIKKSFLDEESSAGRWFFCLQLRQNESKRRGSLISR